MKEREIIERCFRPIAGREEARGLLDDCAVLVPPADRSLVITTDMLAESVHFRGDDPPESIAHKLLAVNLSDLAAKGATPQGCVLGFALPHTCSDAWIEAFAAGLGESTRRFACPLLGGDTIRGVDRLTLSLTALGYCLPGMALDRRAARPGDLVVLSGTVGDAGLGLQQLSHVPETAHPTLVARYRMPEPRLALGQALVGIAHACCDVSDGVLRDAHAIATASRCAIEIDVASLPLSEVFLNVAPALLGVETQALLRFAASAGDDYELLFTIDGDDWGRVLTLSQQLKVRVTPVGRCVMHRPDEPILSLVHPDGRREGSSPLGYEH